MLGDIKTVHNFKYGNTNIPLNYNVSKIKDRLNECTTLISIFKDCINENSITFSDREKRIVIAEEVISSSFIEGYETYLLPEYVVDGKSSGTLNDRATLSGYNAYNYVFDDYKKEQLTTEEILTVWKKLVSYKVFFRKNYRNKGVRVGNTFKTSHVAPPAKYVKSLLSDMFESMSNYEKEECDVYNILSSIIFHYIYTFIHPFLDGNGRSARLFEQKMIYSTVNIDCCIPFSTEILKNKKMYYNAFNSGKVFNESSLGVFSIDITDFINNNLYFLEMGILNILKITNKKIKKISNINLYSKEFEEIIDFVGCAKREDVINKLGLQDYCELLLDGSLRETEFGIEFDFEDKQEFFEIRDKKWGLINGSREN